MAPRLILAALVFAGLLASPVVAQETRPIVPRLVFDIDGQAPAPPAGLPVAARVAVAAVDGASDARLALVRGWPVWLAITGADADDVDAQAWAVRVRELVTGVPTLAAVELQVTGADPRRTAFLVKLAAVEIRARSSAVPIVVSGLTTATRDAVLTSDVAPSVDASAVSSATIDVTADAAWIADRDPDASLVELDVPLPAEAVSRTFLARELARLGSPIAARGYRVSASDIREVMAVVDRLRDVYAGEMSGVAATGDTLVLRAGEEDVTARHAPRLLFNLATLGTYLAIETHAPGEQVLDVSIVLPSAGDVVVRDPLSGRDRRATRTTRDDRAQRTHATVVLPGPGSWLLDFNHGADTAFVQREDVTGARQLSVEEILARHQARQAVERDASPRYVMNARIQQYFRPSVTDPGFDVITENRFFVDRVEGTEWEEREFSVNGAKFGEPRPPFPLLQPEKVLTPPLSIELDARYRYRLQGTATVDGRSAWVVAFEPQRGDRSLYKGTVWIDRETYVRLRQQAAQTALTAPVISSDEVQDYAPVRTTSGTEVWLPARIYTQQLMLIAGRNLLVERRTTFDAYAIDPPDFAGQRHEARAGSRTMYKDTDVGVRYFVKEGDGRVVSDVATTRAKALALGVTVDPGFRFPLPIGGINYLNFRFRGRPDTQVAVLFAGVLAAGNIQRPKAIANRIDASIDFFAMAPPSTDRLFTNGGERKEESLLTWPLSTGLNLGWQATTYQRVSGQYLFRFDGYVRDSTTADGYVTPTSTVTNGAGLLYEYRRGGYAVTANGTWWRRASWRPWGEPEAPVQTSPTYVKYQATATKVFYLGPFSKLIVNGAWFGGRDLDRFSQYQFGLFDDTKIHGVPSAGVRYGELAMARGQYSFNLLDQYRVDLFVDRAWGRTRGGGLTGLAAVPWEPLTGVGVAFNVRIPRRVAFLRGEIGHSFLPRRYDGLGSTTFQLMLMKPLD
ncbi:MAG: hypothetical protein IT182_18735 [Acidobacteria bacterium]|nr:hypothetical protein [Acidobacteriota bacterium]